MPRQHTDTLSWTAGEKLTAERLAEWAIELPADAVISASKQNGDRPWDATIHTLTARWATD